MERLTFKEYLIEDDRSITLKKINERSKPLIEHLIKILKYQSEYDYNNHLTDINGWLFGIQNVIKSCTVKLKSDHIKNELIKNIESFKKFEKILKYLEKDYSKLKIDKSDEDVYNIIIDILDEVSLDLSKLKFKNIRDYL